MSKDPSKDQLNDYKEKVKNPGLLLTGNGAPIANKNASLTVGPRGPLLMQDFVFMDDISHVTLERIPERVVHARGSGAHGYFEVTRDVTRYSKAKVFSKIGHRTPAFVRFSMVGGELGSAETVRNTRGFAVKFYTEQGVWDLVGNNAPMFFLRDPILFPDLIHSQRRNPVTNLTDADMFWDFASLRPETTNQILFQFSDRGIPDGYRYMNGHGVNTFKLVNGLNEYYWCKFHFKSNQGIKNLSPEKAARLAATEPDYATKDLYNAIARGDYPSWTLYIQIMTPKQAETYTYNPFDATKVWPKEEFPLIPVGKLVLDENPENYFADVEQAAFNPAHMPPGIEPSADKILQGRLFSYADSQRHRLGPNHLHLPVNCPYKTVATTNYQRDAKMSAVDQDGAPNYYPNSFSGPVVDPGSRSVTFRASGLVDRHEEPCDDFDQPAEFWRDTLDEEQKGRLVDNLVDSLKEASVFLIERALSNFANVDLDLHRRLVDGLRKAGVPINCAGRSANL